MNIESVQQKINLLCIEIERQSDRSMEDWISFTYRLHELYDSFCNESGVQSDCKRGCSYCCNHWVEDIYSFESYAIQDYLRKNYSNRLKRIRIEAAGAVREMEQLYIEHQDLNETELLQKFYELQIPCPLLGDNGECLVYPVRPLTCRSFYSHSRDRFCVPPVAEELENGTFLVALDNDIEDRLDELHFSASMGNEFPTGLRMILEATE